MHGHIYKLDVGMLSMAEKIDRLMVVLTINRLIVYLYVCIVINQFIA